MTIRHFTLASSALALLTATSFAANRTWNVASSTEADFSLGSNWTATFAGNWAAADIAIINNGGTVVISAGANISIAELRDGNDELNLGNTGHVKQTGGSLTLSDGLVVGRQGSAVATYDFTGGTITARRLRVGGGATAATGTFTISGATTQLNTGVGTDGFVSIGSPGTGTVTLSNSATWTHATGFFAVGSDNSVPAAVGGSGTLNVQSGAKLFITGSGTGGDLYIGKNSGGNGIVTLVGANSQIDLGVDGSLILGGTNDATGGYGTGALQLDGGTLFSRAIVKGTSGTATVNFNGGTIKATAANSDFFGSSQTANTSALTSSSLTVQAGGLIFDTNGFAVNIAQGLSGAGGLTKIGTGTLILSGPNVFNGATVLSGGTLALGASNALPDASNLSLNSGALALNGFSDTVGILTIGGSGTIDFGASAGANSLIFANSAGASWNGTLTLLNFNPATDTLAFSGNGGLTGSQLNSIALSGFTVTGLNGTGALQFTAVPEPATYGIATGALLFAAVLLRRRGA